MRCHSLLPGCWPWAGALGPAGLSWMLWMLWGAGTVGNSQHCRLGPGAVPQWWQVWLGRLWQLMAVSLGCTWGSSVLLGLTLASGSLCLGQGTLSCGVSAPGPRSVGFWGLGFAAAAPRLRLVPLQRCPAPAGALGHPGPVLELQLSPDPLCLQALTLSLPSQDFGLQMPLWG